MGYGLALLMSTRADHARRLELSSVEDAANPNAVGVEVAFAALEPELAKHVGGRPLVLEGVERGVAARYFPARSRWSTGSRRKSP